jgi:hypothetical protein
MSGTYHFVGLHYGGGWNESPLPWIDSDVALVGADPSLVTLQRSNDALTDVRGATTPNFRLVNIGSTGTLTLAGLTLRGGNIGAFWSYGSVNLFNVAVKENTQYFSGWFAHGGGAHLWQGSAQFVDGEFSDNMGLCWAGALKVIGGTQLSIDGTSFLRNATTNDCGSAGAVLVEGAGTELQMERATVDGNGGGWVGGQIVIQNSATATISDTLIARSQRSGFEMSNATVEISNSRFLDNAWRAVYKNGAGTLTVSGTVFESLQGWKSNFYVEGATTGQTVVSDSTFLHKSGRISISGGQHLEMYRTVYPEGDDDLVIDLQTVMGENSRTVNDSGDGDSGASDLLNFPVIETARLNPDGTVEIAGFAAPGMRIEVYESWDHPSKIGVSKTYLTHFIEGSSDDLDTTQDSYGPTVAGANVGSDTSNRFKFVIDGQGLSATAQAALRSGGLITLLGTLNGKTSEFANSIEITTGP